MSNNNPEKPKAKWATRRQRCPECRHWLLRSGYCASCKEITSPPLLLKEEKRKKQKRKEQKPQRKKISPEEARALTKQKVASHPHGWQPWHDDVVQLRAFTHLTVERIAEVVKLSLSTISHFISSQYCKDQLRRIRERRRAAFERTELAIEERLNRLVEDAIRVYENALRAGSDAEDVIRARLATEILRGLGVFVAHGKLDMDNKLDAWIEEIKKV